MSIWVTLDLIQYGNTPCITLTILQWLVSWCNLLILNMLFPLRMTPLVLNTHPPRLWPWNKLLANFSLFHFGFLSMYFRAMCYSSTYVPHVLLYSMLQDVFQVATFSNASPQHGYRTIQKKRILANPNIFNSCIHISRQWSHGPILLQICALFQMPNTQTHLQVSLLIS